MAMLPATAPMMNRNMASLLSSDFGDVSHYSEQDECHDVPSCRGRWRSKAYARGGALASAASWEVGRAALRRRVGSTQREWEILPAATHESDRWTRVSGAPAYTARRAGTARPTD